MNDPRLLMASLGFKDYALDIQRRCISLVQNYSSNAIKLTEKKKKIHLFKQQKETHWKSEVIPNWG